MRIISRSEEESLKIGEAIGRSLKGGEVICLLGDLGAGKTTLVKGIAKGMGIFQDYQVRSPTFTLVNQYPTEKGTLIHVDLYRTREDIDLSEFVGKGVLVIEWAEGLELCQCTIRIEFFQEERILEFLGCEDLLKAFSMTKAVEIL
ncbi:MAG: tRNA (adenosine(37)-N6)-threonylcarbamoyltransferase complex ATPase subunit type 1 TsaE [Aquificaceae bacterium]